MAPRLGGMFATGALGPVHYAGQCILARRAEEGLKELAVENLQGGLVRGISQAAARVGISPSDIERLLPMAELRPLLARLAVSQPKVLEAWQLYAGGLGGLLTGVADLTVDGRAPDTALCVQRLARKVQRDKPFSEPLQRLADDLADWQDALHRCVEILNDTTALEKAYKRRRLRKILLGVAVGLVGAVAVMVIVWVRAARARVLAVIENTDACAATALTESDLDRVSDELRVRAKGNVERCQAALAMEARVKEEQRLREEREREATKAKEALETQCTALVAHMDAGKLAPEDEAFAKGSAGLVGRIARGALDLADYGPAEPELPCKGTKVEARLVAAFRKAVLAKPWNVPKVESTSAATREALVQGEGELPAKLKTMMGTRAADAAKKAITSGKPEHAARAIALCETAKALGTAPVGPCDGVRGLAK